MCGFAGLFIPRGAAVVDADLGAMLAVLKHRGPDGEQTYVSEDRRFQACFARLAIIDLETGDQPFIEDGGRRVLMANGEIYNDRELRKSAAAKNYPFRSKGDIEVVLALSAEIGDAFVDELNGMYALALFDRRQDRLLLVRDRLGVKPLYWAKLPGGGILFASEIKPLLVSGLIGAGVNESAVSSYLAHGYVPAPETLFAGINKLPAGTLLTAGGGGEISTRRYWRAKPAVDAPGSEGEAAERLTELLRDSVRLQLRSDVPLGILLSGGLDSGLITALAAEYSAQPLNTFTVRFEGSEADETPLAAEVAQRYATRHRVLDLPAAEVAGHLAKLAWYCDEPISDPALLPNYLIEKTLAGHVKVALNGTGGDELFAGYGRYFRLPVEARYLALPGWFRGGIVEPVASALAPMTAWRLARAGKFDADRGNYLHDHVTYFPPPVRALMGNVQALPGAAQAAYFDEFDGPPETAALYADLNTYLPENLLTLLDRTSMAHGVEGRVPFLDHRLVEAALAVPPEFRTPGGRQKALERKMAEPFLPPSVLGAPKRGFAAPVPAWMEAGLGALAGRLLASPRALERGWWSAAGIKRLLAAPRKHGFRVYALLALEIAIRVHIEGRPQDGPPDGGLEALADAV